jgi:outer membrane protein assembly factor BamB
MKAMRLTLIGYALLVSLLAASSSPLRADEKEDARAAAHRTLERFQALEKERPNDGLLVFYEAIVRLRLGEREKVFQLLRSLKGRHLGLVPVCDAGFDGIWDDKEFQKIRQELAAEETRTPTAPVAFRLNDPKLIPEGVAYDSKRDRFFLGSIAQHKIVVTSVKGEGTRDFSRADDKLDAVLGLTIDVTGGYLYAVTTNGFENSVEKTRRNAVVRYDLKDGRLLDRFDAPEALQLNDLTVTPDGTIYSTDSFGGSLFRKKPGEKSLTRFGAAGGLRGANGIALAGDGKLYVATSTGIALINLETGAPTRVPQPDTVVTGGCDGLYWHDGDLFGNQNVTNPGRVIRMKLIDSGTRIAGLKVLQSSHHPDFSEPTTGAIAHEALNVIANSYVGHYQPDGTIQDAANLKGTAVVAVPLK